MADVKLTDKNALTSLASGDFIHVVDVSDTAADPAGTSKKMTAANVHAFGDSRTATLTNKTIDGDDNTVQDLPYSALKSTARSGSDTTVVTGTAGTSGDLSQWNADGDLVDGPTPPSGTIVGTSDTQTLTNKTINTASNTITVVEADISDLNHDIAAASLTTAGKVELATVAETNTGTDATRAVTPDGLDGWTGSAQVATVGTITSGTWSGTAIEGTAIASTGEVGGSKFLREDGDGTCSWIAIPGGGDLLSTNNLSDVANAATSFSNIKQAASTTATGVVELATTAETTTGTDTTRAVTPDGLQDGYQGSANVTTLGTIATGTWQGTAIDQTYLAGQSGTNTGDEAAASVTVAGVVEIATAAETDTGTDATRAVSPDGLAGSTIFGRKYAQIVAFDFTTDTATGDGAGYFHVPAGYNGMNLVEVHAEVITAGTTGTTDVQIHNLTQTADMLTTKITIDSAETGSDTAAAAAVIDAANDDVATNDLLRIDVDAVSTTAAKGLIVTMGFQLP